LEELVTQLASVCKGIGNNELEIKFREASTMMKRDIVFAASLYL
jgi:ATP-dependent RNA helicase DOB1